MNFLRDLFAGFVRARHFARHFRRLFVLDALRDTTILREMPAPLADRLRTVSRADVSTVCSELESSPDGLTDQQADAVRARVGPNEVVHERPLPWWGHLWQSYRTPFNLLLTLLAVVSYVTDDLKATVVISTMVLLATLVRFWEEHKSNKAADRLKAMVSNTATVLRRSATAVSERVGDQGRVPRTGARFIELPIAMLVPGDVIRLAAGDMIPGDCRIVQAQDLYVNQAAMTGESLPVEKYVEQRDPGTTNALELDNVIFMGTNIISGSATAVVVTTGSRTYFGALAQRVTTAEHAPTQFQAGMNQVSWLLIRFMFIMTPIVLILNGVTKGDWLEAILFTLSVAIGLTPEMLPTIVTATLAKGAVRLSRQQVIVKRLDSIQNFGAMDVLCTDKTGTLTQDKVLLDRHVDVWGEPSERVLHYAYLNSHYQTGLKNLLDVAVLAHGELHHELDIARTFRLVDEIPFDFQRRRMSVVVAEHEEHYLLICKGAVDEVLEVCTRVRHGDVDEALTDRLLGRIRCVTMSLNQEGLRVVAVATSELPPISRDYRVPDERDLTLIGYVAFLDPPKDTSAAALDALASHGVTVKVLTGDNELVTAKICREVGVAFDGILLGSDIDRMDDGALAVAAEAHHVFARLTPAQKERLVGAIKAGGHVVGFMGDGINDAAALRTADIGISVDTAVDIAKEAADIILLEKSLLVLEQGVVLGRETFANMLKYIRMTASSNFGNVFSVLVASAFLPFLPMLPIHLLVQNLLSDFSLSTIPFDRVDSELVKTPQRWQPSHIGRFMVYFGPISSVFDLVTFWVMWTVFGANTVERQTLFQSGWFLEGLLTQTLIVHMIRTPRVPFAQSRASGPLMASTAAIIGAGIFIVMGPFAHYFKLQALPGSYFPILALILVSYMTVTQLMKGFYTRRFGWQ
jgi:Mg2+-importing ATPase